MGEVDFGDFQKLDIRIGTVVKAEVPEWSHWVMKLTVDLGNGLGEKTIFAGIMKFYKPEEVEGRQFAFVVNLKPKKIGPEGDFSEGMMLMAEGGLDLSDDDEEVAPVPISPEKKVPNGVLVR